MADVNKVILIGRIGRDPEVRQVSEKMTVANFSVGTSEKYKDRDGQVVERTEWTTITACGQLAEIVERYFKKGMLVYVEGKLRTESYEKNGEKRNFTKVIADTAQMLERKNEDGTS